MLIRILHPASLPDATRKQLEKHVKESFDAELAAEVRELDVRSAFHPRRKQYEGEPILRRLASLKGAEGRLVAILDQDLFARGLNFIFGEADPVHGVAIVSLHRLYPNTLSSGEGLFQTRLATEVIHELGHTFALHHCSNPHCVMFFSNSISDSDRKGLRFCPECRSKLLSPA